MHAITTLKSWIEEEKSNGAQYTQHAVLSTIGLDNSPHARVVAIREITEDTLLFFTQKITRKIQEIQANNKVTLTFWFELHARQVIIEGEAGLLSVEENAKYWNQYPKQAQIRFCSYAPTSGLPIESKQILEEKRIKLEKEFQNQPIPPSPDYCGIRIKPSRIAFYTYRLDELSDVIEYRLDGNNFVKQVLSP